MVKIKTTTLVTTIIIAITIILTTMIVMNDKDNDNGNNNNNNDNNIHLCKTRLVRCVYHFIPLSLMIALPLDDSIYGCGAMT